MAISFQCGCGRTLRVKDELAGRKVRCPKCSSILTVPQPDAADGFVTHTTSAGEREPDWHEPEASMSTPITDRPEHGPKTVLKKRRPASKRERKERRLPKVFINAEVAAGVVMIVAAIAWFVCGLLWLNRIFFYPPVLLVLGIGAIYKGFTAPD